MASSLLHTTASAILARDARQTINDESFGLPINAALQKMSSKTKGDVDFCYLHEAGIANV